MEMLNVLLFFIGGFGFGYGLASRSERKESESIIGYFDQIDKAEARMKEKLQNEK